MVQSSDYNLPVNDVDMHPDKNFESASSLKIAANLPNPWEDVGTYKPENVKPMMEWKGPSKIKGSDKGRPPKREGD